MWKEKFSRRRFLQSTVAVGTAMVAGDFLSFGSWRKVAEAAEIIKIPSLCGACSAWCGMWIHVKNGRIWKVTGQKDHPTSRGKLCARGHAGVTWAYTQDRITQPMKRVGDNEFIPITWDQAYFEISEKLKTVLIEHGPQKVFYSQNAKPTSRFYMKRFMDGIGASTIQSHHSICSTARDVANKWTTGSMATADIGNTKFIVFLGRSYADGISPSGVANLTATREKGTQVVIVDPRFNSSCILADQWVPIRPGTDLALLLAISHTLIKEELYDKDFVEQYTVGFDAFRNTMAQYTAEWAAPLTDIPAEIITLIARGLGNNRPKSCIEQGYKAPNGANYANGTQTFRMMASVNALLGNYGKSGGMKFPISPKLGSLDKNIYPVPPTPTASRCDGVGMKGEYPLCQTSQGIPHIMPQRAIEGKAKAGFIYSFNPVRNSPNLEHMIEGYKKLDLLVTIDIQWSETAMVSHYVLPECSFPEREDLPTELAGSRPGVTMRCQAISLVHPHTKPMEDIVTGLAEHMGIGHYFNFTREEAAAAMLKPLGVTAEDLRKKGTIMLSMPEEKELTFSTKSKKVELYSQAFADHGFEPVPVWQPPLVKADKDTFVLIHGKQGIMSHTATANLPSLLAIAKRYKLERLWINTDRAKALGLKDGDLVELSSPQATKRIQIMVTERIHPEAAFIPGGYGNTSPRLQTGYGFGISPNDFTTSQVEPISGHAMMMEVLVKIRKVGG